MISFSSSLYFKYVPGSSCAPLDSLIALALISLCDGSSDGCNMRNHSEPITVSLRHSSLGSDPIAAHWSQEKPGGWSQDGCQLVHTDATTSTLHCSLLSNYAVLQVGQRVTD